MRGAGHIKKSILFLLIVAMAFLFIVPIYFTLINSFKPLREIVTSYTSFPRSFYLGNYIKAWDKSNYPRSFANSLIITASGLIGIIIVSSMAGYILSRTQGKLSWTIFIVITFTILVPFHAYMIPLTVFMTKLHLTNSIPGIVIAYWGIGANLATFLYHGFVKTIPRELEEYAVVEGCSSFQTFFRIVFPLLKPITSTIAVLDALWIWNDFLLPLLVLQKRSVQTIPLSQFIFFGEYISEWGLALSGLVLAIIPIVAFYIFMQRYIIAGITDGALKG